MLTQDDWIERYRQRIIDIAKVSETVADDCCQATCFSELAEGYEDDPEGAADMEMSYWTD